MIETARLVLRLPVEEDIPEVIRFYSENEAHLEPWSPNSPPGFLTEEYWREQVRARADEHALGTAARFFVFAREEPARVAGNVSLTGVSRGALQQCFLGYSLAEWAQGRGYMQEAVRGAVTYAFVELGLHRVAASYMPHNRRSARVLRDAGFEVEGYSRAHLLIAGRWEDHVSTAIVNPAHR